MNDTVLEIGYGREDITPDYPVNLAGSAANRVSEGVLDRLYITCIAVRYATETFLIATMDFVGAYEEYSAPARTAIAEAIGLPEDRVILNATHTHSSVAIRNENGVGIRQYRTEFYARAVEAAKAAIADLSPSEVSYGSTMTKGMAWVRHYKIADGTFAGANYGSFKPGIVGHANDPDPEMQVIRFHREEKKDIILMNFPAHATMNSHTKLISADFPSPARDYVARETGALVAYFIAGAGDQVPSSRVPEECFSKDYQVYGAEVGRLALSCLQNPTKLDSTKLLYNKRTFVGQSNKTDLDKADQALAVQKIWEQVGGRGTPEGKTAAKEHGFSSVYAVTALLNRMKFEDTRSLELKTLAIGDLAIVFASYEMFGDSAQRIKKGSPYGLTFLVSCSQNHDGYLPSELGWKLRCYEAQITRYAPGTAEKLAAEYVDMLKEMKNA